MWSDVKVRVVCDKYDLQLVALLLVISGTHVAAADVSQVRRSTLAECDCASGRICMVCLL